MPTAPDNYAIFLSPLPKNRLCRTYTSPRGQSRVGRTSSKGQTTPLKGSISLWGGVRLHGVPGPLFHNHWEWLAIVLSPCDRMWALCRELFTEKPVFVLAAICEGCDFIAKEIWLYCCFGCCSSTIKTITIDDYQLKEHVEHTFGWECSFLTGFFKSAF